jgi:hypothetical protein
MKAALVLAVFLLAAVGALAWAGLAVTGDVASPPLGIVKYIWIGGAIVCAGVIAFFIWLATKG